MILLLYASLLISVYCYRLPPFISHIRQSQTKLQLDLINEFPLSTSIAGTIGLFGLAKVISYWRMQYLQASTISGIPQGSNVVEFDAKDGKNIFYLSNNCEYTAIMPIPSGESDQKKIKDKVAINDRLILDSIINANTNG